MLTRIRQRLAADDGLTLVEMIVAIFVIGVALFALLSALVTAVRGVGEQQFRSAATRVATQQLELARQLLTEDFDDEDAIPGVGGPVMIPMDGRDYELSTAVELVGDVDPSAVGADAEAKLVTMTVAWTYGTGQRSTTFSSAVAPPMFDEARLDIDPIPGSVQLDEDGFSAVDLELQIRPNGFTYAGSILVRWTDDNGIDQHMIPSADPSGAWTMTIPAGGLRVADAVEGSRLSFLATAGSVVNVGSVVLIPDGWTPPDPGPDPDDPDPDDPGPEDPDPEEPEAPAPTIATAAITQPASPTSIQVRQPPGGSDNCSNANCTNRYPVTFRLTVSVPDGATVDAVQVTYSVRGGAGGYSLSEVAPGTWEGTIPADSQNFGKFTPGTNRIFRFELYHNGKSVPLESLVPRTVVES